MPDTIPPPTTVGEIVALNVVEIATTDAVVRIKLSPTDQQILGMLAAWMDAGPTAWEVSRLKCDIALTLDRRSNFFRFSSFGLDSSSGS